MPNFSRYRDKKAAIRAAHQFVHSMYGDGRPPQVTLPPLKPKRAKREADPNAPPMEREVLKAVWKLLAHHPKVAWITRVNSGNISIGESDGGQRFVHFNYKRGMSDLIGQTRDGRFIAVEIKREGAALMDHQRDFLNEVRANGGVAFVARSIADAEDELRRA